MKLTKQFLLNEDVNTNKKIGNQPVINYLITDVYFRDKNDKQKIKKELSEFEEYLKKGNNPNLFYKNWTPLKVAVYLCATYPNITEFIELVELLLKYKADPNLKSPNGNSAMDYAKKNNLTPVLNLFKQYGYDAL